jgi:hypothetical protein
LRQKLLIRGAGVPSHDTAQRGVRFQRRRVDADRFAVDQARIGEPLQNPREYGFVRFEIDQATRARNRRMIRRGASGSTSHRNSRSVNESAARHAMARSVSKPSK